MKGLYGCILFFFVSTIVYGQSGNFRSRASGDWGTPATWERDVNGNGIFGEAGDEVISSVSPNSSSGTITIRTANSVTVSGEESASTLVMANSSTAILTITSSGRLRLFGQLTLGLTLNRGRVEVSGVLQFEDGSTVVNSTSERLIIHNGGKYRLNYSTGGIIYSSDFQPGSTLEFTGYNDAAAIAPTLESSPMTFDNLEWNCTSQGNDVDLGGILSTINGDLTVNSTSPDQWVLMLSDAGNLQLSIGGDLIVNNDSYVYLSGYSGGANVSVAVAGDVRLNISTGQVILTGSSGAGLLDVAGNLELNTPGSQINLTASSGPGTLIVDSTSTITGGQILKTPL